MSSDVADETTTQIRLWVKIYGIETILPWYLPTYTETVRHQHRSPSSGMVMCSRYLREDVMKVEWNLIKG